MLKKHEKLTRWQGQGGKPDWVALYNSKFFLANEQAKKKN